VSARTRYRLGVAYRVAVCPLCFALVYGGATLIKLGNWIAWHRWEVVDVGGATIY
jgi:hypothetical protein